MHDVPRAVHYKCLDELVFITWQILRGNSFSAEMHRILRFVKHFGLLTRLVDNTMHDVPQAVHCKCLDALVFNTLQILREAGMASPR
jgi:hypothetical protein